MTDQCNAAGCYLLSVVQAVTNTGIEHLNFIINQWSQITEDTIDRTLYAYPRYYSENMHLVDLHVVMDNSRIRNQKSRFFARNRKNRNLDFFSAIFVFFFSIFSNARCCADGIWFVPSH